MFRPLSKPCHSNPSKRVGEQVASQQNSPLTCRQSRAGATKAVHPTEFRTLLGLVTNLQRVERLAQQDSQKYLSPQEIVLLQSRIARLRKSIPSDVLNSYETVKCSDPEAFLDTRLFPLMVLLAVIAIWAEQKQHRASFQDHRAGLTFRVRRVKWPGLRRARYSLLQKEKGV